MQAAAAKVSPAAAAAAKVSPAAAELSPAAAKVSPAAEALVSQYIKPNKEEYTFIDFNNRKENGSMLLDVDFYFLDYDNDGNISSQEFDQQIMKYFNKDEALKRQVLDDFNFEKFDKNRDGNIDRDEFNEANISDKLRNDPQWHRQGTEYKDIFVGNDNVSFHGMGQPLLLRYNLFIFMRYLVEVKGVVRYVNFAESQPNEREIFSLVCNNSMCEFHDMPIKDYHTPTFDQLTQFVDLVEDSYTKELNIVAHCSFGDGRTGFMMLAYLVKRDSTNLGIYLEDIDNILAKMTTNPPLYHHKDRFIAFIEGKNLYKLLVENYSESSAKEIFYDDIAVEAKPDEWGEGWVAEVNKYITEFQTLLTNGKMGTLSKKAMEEEVPKKDLIKAQDADDLVAIMNLMIKTFRARPPTAPDVGPVPKFEALQIIVKQVERANLLKDRLTLLKQYLTQLKGGNKLKYRKTIKKRRSKKTKKKRKSRKKRSKKTKKK